MGQLLSQDTVRAKKKHRWIGASPAQRQPGHPCSELLELRGWHWASPVLCRTRTQLKPPAGAKLALCRGSVTHLCLSLQCNPEWTYYPGYCIIHHLMANWWEPEKLVRSCYKRRLQKKMATSSWTQWCWCLSGVENPPAKHRCLSACLGKKMIICFCFSECCHPDIPEEQNFPVPPQYRCQVDKASYLWAMCKKAEAERTCTRFLQYVTQDLMFFPFTGKSQVAQITCSRRFKFPFQAFIYFTAYGPTTTTSHN